MYESGLYSPFHTYIEVLRLTGRNILCEIEARVVRGGNCVLLIVRKHWKMKILHLLAWWLCIAAMLSAALGLIAYHHVTSISHDGRVHMKRAQALLAQVIQHPSDPSIVLSAQQEFLAALNAYRRLESDLNTLPASSTSLPYYGARLQD